MTLDNLRSQIVIAQQDIAAMQRQIPVATPRRANKLRRRIRKARKWIVATYAEIERLRREVLWPGS